MYSNRFRRCFRGQCGELSEVPYLVTKKSGNLASKSIKATCPQATSKKLRLHSIWLFKYDYVITMNEYSVEEE